MIKLKLFQEEDLAFAAKSLLERMQKQNNLKFNLEICFDYTINELGIYYPAAHGHKIFVNPANCLSLSEAVIDINNLFYIGYCRDVSIFGIILHEAAHFFSYKVFPKMIQDYKEKFPTKRFYLNSYSNNELEDELAECFVLYICNPGLLKLISKEHFNFFKKHFKSPVASSNKQMFRIYEDFPIEIKQELESKWKIVYDVNQEKFIKKGN